MDAFKFSFIFRIGVFADDKFFSIGIVAWVDAHAFDELNGFKCLIGREVNIGNKWRTLGVK